MMLYALLPLPVVAIMVWAYRMERLREETRRDAWITHQRSCKPTPPPPPPRPRGPGYQDDSQPGVRRGMRL